MQVNWNDFLSFALGGGLTAVVAAYIAFKTRKAEIEKIEASALQMIKDNYREFVEDNDRMIQKLRDELREVYKRLEEYEKRCKNCAR